MYDATCYGPCQYPPPPPRLYTHDNLVVTVRSLPDRKLVAVRRPKDGRFQVRSARRLSRQGVHPRRWVLLGGRGHKDVRVAKDQITGVRLSVYNSCIV